MRITEMTPKNQARYFKQNRRTMPENDFKYFLSISKTLPHVPAKAEAHLLRRLMSKSGLTEAQVRAIPAYRQMLSQTQEQLIYSDNPEKHQLRRFFRSITRETGLTIEHPTSLSLAKERINADALSNYSYSLSRQILRGGINLKMLNDKLIITLYHFFTHNHSKI